MQKVNRLELFRTFKKFAQGHNGRCNLKYVASPDNTENWAHAIALILWTD